LIYGSGMLSLSNPSTWFLFAMLTIFPAAVFISNSVKEWSLHFLLSKHFNFRRELKNLNMRAFKAIYDEKTPDTTFMGLTPNKKKVFLLNSIKHLLACGTTGSGKTMVLLNFILSMTKNHYPGAIIDGKGDTGKGSILDTFQKLGTSRKIYVINLNDPKNSDKYNPFKNTSYTMVKDMLMNMTEWSEEHYKSNTERYLQKLAELLEKSKIELSFADIVRCMPTDNFLKLSNALVKREFITKQEHILNAEIADTSGKIAQGAIARFSTIAEGELGTIFDKSGVDISQVIEENAIILFVLNPLSYPELSKAIGKVILIDSKKAISRSFGNSKRKFFIMDEISSYASPALIDIINKSRSANITCILSTQSLSDLDYAGGEFYKEQVIENCNNFIVLRQNSAVNAEKWANIIGTRQSLDMTYQIGYNKHGLAEDTGLGSGRASREYLYHPDYIKSLEVGKGIYVTKDDNMHTRININNLFS